MPLRTDGVHGVLNRTFDTLSKIATLNRSFYERGELLERSVYLGPRELRSLAAPEISDD